MADSGDDKLQRLSSALNEHSAEGIEILYAEPSRLANLMILLIASLLLMTLVWSFFGRADVVVTANGVLSPEEDVRRIYTPIQGELVDIYLTEGLPVEQGDILARLNAREAIQAATNALDADLQLAEAEQEYREFPRLKQLLTQQAEALQRQLTTQANLHEKRVTEGLSKLAESQKAKLEEARGNLEKARIASESARREAEKYQRLFALPGGGGVSRNDVDERRDAQRAAETNLRLARARLGELDFQLSEEYAQAKAELEGSDQKLTELRIEHESLLNRIEREENKVELKLRGARLAAEAAQRIQFENIDEDNYLRVLAPVSGIVTDVVYSQAGEKVQANTPLGSIAPDGATPVLKINIPERDRGFLREGLQVKMKFSAFPYQRYGFIEGTLDYISPTAQSGSEGGGLFYKGHVSLAQTHFTVDDNDYPLRFGMTATAEIVVRKRRLIDLALDPLRKLEG
ncbi:MAG: HlyD family efflux transporter periplasmic adaptor subunit [Candidatus Thiodiazotropha sp.]